MTTAQTIVETKKQEAATESESGETTTETASGQTGDNVTDIITNTDEDLSVETGTEVITESEQGSGETEDSEEIVTDVASATEATTAPSLEEVTVVDVTIESKEGSGDAENSEESVTESDSTDKESDTEQGSGFTDTLSTTTEEAVTVTDYNENIQEIKIETSGEQTATDIDSDETKKEEVPVDDASHQRSVRAMLEKACCQADTTMIDPSIPGQDQPPPATPEKRIASSLSIPASNGPGDMESRAVGSSPPPVNTFSSQDTDDKDLDIDNNMDTTITTTQQLANKSLKRDTNEATTLTLCPQTKPRVAEHAQPVPVIKRPDPKIAQEPPGCVTLCEQTFLSRNAPALPADVIDRTQDPVVYPHIEDKELPSTAGSSQRNGPPPRPPSTLPPPHRPKSSEHDRRAREISQDGSTGSLVSSFA